MTAIAGIIHLDGRPVDRSTIERMQHLLTPYGTEAQHYIHQGNSAFLRTLLRTTPEDLFDTQPLVHAETGTTLLFDGRIDNREELATTLELAPADLARMSDSDVVLKACLRWGSSASERLLGDFAIACWSPREKKLWLARDPLAVRPLFWYRKDQLFAFATMPKALFAIPGVPRAMCEERLHDYLCLMPMKGPESFFKDVFRIEPGHVLVLHGDHISSTAFHAFDPKKELRLGSDDEYVEAFREQLDRAVACRLRALGPVASHLSSGRDSSTVTAVAAKQLARKNDILLAYTAVPREGFNGPVPHGYHGDETLGAKAVVDMYPNIRHTLIRSEPSIGLVSHLWNDIEMLERPPLNPCNMNWLTAIQRAVADRGSKVLLTGERGNMTISHSGETYLPSLVRAGRWHAWARENLALKRRRPQLSWLTLLKHSFLPFLPLWAWQSIQTGRNRKWRLDLFSAIHPDFMQKMNTKQRCRAQDWDPTYRPRWNHVQDTIELINNQDNGDHRAGANHHGIEVRDPTADARLVDMCLAIPESQFLRNGQLYSLLFRAMRHDLPAEILFPKTKGYQMADWYEQMERSLNQIKDELQGLAEHKGIGNFIDLKQLATDVDQWTEQDHHEIEALARKYRSRLLRAISVGNFIRYVEATNRS